MVRPLRGRFLCGVVRPLRGQFLYGVDSLLASSRFGATRWAQPTETALQPCVFSLRGNSPNTYRAHARGYNLPRATLARGERTSDRPQARTVLDNEEFLPLSCGRGVLS